MAQSWWGKKKPKWEGAQCILEIARRPVWLEPTKRGERPGARPCGRGFSLPETRALESLNKDSSGSGVIFFFFFWCPFKGSLWLLSGK